MCFNYGCMVISNLVISTTSNLSNALLTGLNSLTKISFWGCNFTSIPDRLFAKAPGLKEIIWEHDVCPENGERIMPNLMLDGTGITKFVFQQRSQT
jgi:hypothetical protein